MAAEPREPRPSQPPQLAQGTGDRAAKAASNPLARVKPRVGAPTGPIVGVDLGTTNSCVAVVKDGKPEVILSREGHNTIPSIVALNARQHIVVGHPARKQMLTNAKLTVFGAKRLVGRPYASDVVQRVKDHFQYSIVEGADGEAAVRLGGEVFSLQQLSAMILIEAKELASTHLGVEVQRAVITVPAYYNEHQRQAVRAAGALAGLHVERIINEPTAAALAFGYRRKLEKRVLVYDLGGGTFDASLMHIGNDVYEVLATGGDTFLGGVDFDQAIADHLAAEATAALGSEFAPSPEVRQRLVDAAEHAKRLLSEQSEARVALPFLAMRPNGKPFDLDVVLTRATVDELCAPLVERTVQVCQEVTKAAKVWPDQIDDVLLVGGMSRMPLVRQAIVALTGKQPNAGVHPDEAVALGAALFAASLGQVEGVTLIDVLPMSIGVGVPGGAFKKLIERNARLPATKSFTLTTVRDNQESIQLAIYQGEGEHTDEAEYLGTAKVSPLPPGPKGSVSVELEFALSEECLLTVTARDLARQQLVQSTFSTRDTPDVVKARVARAQRIAAAVQAARAATAAKAGKVQTAAREPQGGWLARFFRRLFGGG